MDKGFDKLGFLQYLEKELKTSWNVYLCELISNLIEYATKNKHVSKDQLVYFMSDMLPEVEFGEVARFMDDACLTKYGIEAKKAAEKAALEQDEE